MTIKKAIDHFIWKFKNKWQPTQKDVDCLNEIITFVEDKHKKQFNDYQLFAKLYVMVYAQYLKRYDATVFDDLPRNELTRYLDQPLERIIQRFTDRLNESELYEFMEKHGFDGHPATKSPEEKRQEMKKLDELNHDVLLTNSWDYDTVKEHLEHQINTTINLLR